MADLAIEPTPAIAQPATQAAVARHRRVRNLALTAGVLGVVLGLWLLWAGGAGGRRLAADGARVDATVTAVAPQRINGAGNERGLVTFRYTFGSEERTVSNTVGGDILDYHVGDPVQVVVPLDDPGGARLARQLDPPGWEAPGALLLAGGLVAGTWGLVRARALRRTVACLESGPWLAVRAGHDPEALTGMGGVRSMGIVGLAREPGDREVLVITRGLRRPGPEVEPLAWVVGWGTTRMVLSPPGGGRLLEVRPVVPRRPIRASGGTDR